MVLYNVKEIYDETFASKLAIIGELISLFTIFYTILLLIIIGKKTPKTMKRFKFYITLYMTFALLFELFGLFCPATLLHPFPFVVPNIHTSYSYSPVIYSCCATTVAFGMCMLDCSVGIIYERYYILSNTTNSSPKQPFYILGFLLILDFGFLIFLNTIVHVPQLRFFFFLNPDETEIFVKSLIEGIETKIPFENIIIFRNATSHSLPWEMAFLILYGLFRVGLAIIGLYLNMKVSKNMLTQIQLSLEVQKANDMLRNIIYIQFIGYISLLVFPLFVTIFCYYFISTPSNIPTITCRCLIGYGLYDSVFTTLFIKPYRKAILWPFYFAKQKFFKSTAIIQTPISTTVIISPSNNAV